MLRVSVHAGPWRQASLFNRLDWLDIGYERLAALADYKVVLFKIGEGAMPPVQVTQYPRWSSSLWDLVMRSIGACLDAYPTKSRGPSKNPRRKTAFAESMCAILSHSPSDGTGGRHIGALQIDLLPPSRGRYVTSASEDLQPDRDPREFTFTPNFLRPAELVMRACTALLSDAAGQPPPVPRQLEPEVETIDGKDYVIVHLLPEPARTGFLRWLDQNDPAIAAPANAPDGLADLELFSLFVHRGI
jgi:hypothetical protein